MGDYKKRRRKYDDDDYDDDDDDYRYSKKKNYKDKDKYRDDKYRDDRYREDRYRDKKRKSSFSFSSLGLATNNVIKTVATGIIAGGTLLMMTVYGFAGALEGPLPLVTLVGSALTTAAVWFFGRPKSELEDQEQFKALNKQIQGLNDTIDTMQQQFDELDARLKNVEVIESFENRLANKTLQQKISSTLPTYEPTIPEGPSQRGNSEEPPVTE